MIEKTSGSGSVLPDGTTCPDPETLDPALEALWIERPHGDVALDLGGHDPTLAGCLLNEGKALLWIASRRITTPRKSAPSF